MKTAVLILAAGGATRFGSVKQLALIDGKPMLQHCVDTASHLSPGAVFTVLGSHADELRCHISGTEIIYNHQWQQGLGSSMAVGVSYLKDKVDAILVLLADQPRIKVDYLERLVALFEGQDVACSQYSSHLGIPAIFGKSHFNALMNLSGDTGGKALLESIRPAPKSLALGDVAADIDYPEDLTAFIQQIEVE